MTSRCKRILSPILSPLQNRKQYQCWPSQSILFALNYLWIYAVFDLFFECRPTQHLSAKSWSLFCRAWFREEVEDFGQKKCEFEVLENEITNNNGNRLRSCFARRTLPSVSHFVSSFQIQLSRFRLNTREGQLNLREAKKHLGIWNIIIFFMKSKGRRRKFWRKGINIGMRKRKWQIWRLHRRQWHQQRRKTLNLSNSWSIHMKLHENFFSIFVFADHCFFRLRKTTHLHLRETTRLHLRGTSQKERRDNCWEMAINSLNDASACPLHSSWILKERKKTLRKKKNVAEQENAEKDMKEI